MTQSSTNGKKLKKSLRKHLQGAHSRLQKAERNLLESLHKADLSLALVMCILGLATFAGSLSLPEYTTTVYTSEDISSTSNLIQPNRDILEGIFPGATHDETYGVDGNNKTTKIKKVGGYTSPNPAGL